MPFKFKIPAPWDRSKTDQVIKAARKVLEPTRVKQGRVPKWLKDRLKQAQKEGRLGATHPWESLLQAAADASGGHHWLDHWGTTMWGGHEWFVSEPYNLDWDILQELQKFAEILGQRFRIDANSWHYPGRTIRIMLAGPGKEGDGRDEERDIDADYP
jgi:hypothetical protein